MWSDMFFDANSVSKEMKCSVRHYCLHFDVDCVFSMLSFSDLTPTGSAEGRRQGEIQGLVQKRPD